MSGHVPKREGYCKQPRKFLKPTGYIWMCNCGRTYRLSEISTHWAEGNDNRRQWREIYDGKFRDVVKSDAYSEVVR